MTVLTSGTKIEAAERTRRAMEMRRLGMSLEAIAGKLGVSRQAVHKMIARAIRRVNRETNLDATAFIALELARLDSWQQSAETIRLNGATEGIRLKAVQSLVAISHRRSLLVGVESVAPAPPGVTVNVATARESAEVRMAPFLAGATLDEKRQLLALIEAAEARQPARQVIEATHGPTAPLMLRDAADATPAPPASYVHQPANDDATK